MTGVNTGAGLDEWERTMDRSSITLRIPKRWLKVGLVVLVTALIIAPATAIASHQFTDVPDSNIFHSDIEWLADTGVTKGCNEDGSEFCPNDNVTRGQMAAFMRRLATNQVVDADKVDGKDASDFLGATAKAADSDLLDGKDSSEFLGATAKAADSDKLDGKNISDIAPVVVAQRDSDGGGVNATGVSSTDKVQVNSVTIDAPTDGVLVISGTVFVNNKSGTEVAYVLEPLIDGSPAVTPEWAGTFFTAASGSAAERTMLPYTVTVPISAGSHTVTQELGPFSGSADFFYNQQNLTVTFYPSGQSSVSSNATPSGAVSSNEESSEMGG